MYVEKSERLIIWNGVSICLLIPTHQCHSKMENTMYAKTQAM